MNLSQLVRFLKGPICENNFQVFVNVSVVLRLHSQLISIYLIATDGHLLLLFTYSGRVLRPRKGLTHTALMWL